MSSSNLYRDTPANKAVVVNLIRLIDLFLAEQISISDFCTQYETAWNFELKKTGLAKDIAESLESVFDLVTWYTPISEDREAYSGFKNKDQVTEEVRRIRATMRITE